MRPGRRVRGAPLKSYPTLHRLLAVLILTVFILPFAVHPFKALLATDNQELKTLSDFAPHTFLPSLSDRFPYGTGNDVSRDRIHVAMSFDENRLNHTFSALRSISYFSNHPLTFHLVSPTSTHPSLRRLQHDLPGDVHVAVHDSRLCVAPNSLISYTSPYTSQPALCRLFLAEIVPSDFVLYLDSDLSALSDLSPCLLLNKKDSILDPDFGPSALIAMSVDMGDLCQVTPDECYPLGMKFRIPPALDCGTTPTRAKAYKKKGVFCNPHAQYEPYVFNAGVALMNLKRMRETHFTLRLAQATLFTWHSLGQKPALLGDQDLFNNYFRLYPESVVNLPCGCNYQFAGTRRESKCPGRKLVISHAWSKPLKEKRNDTFRNLFHYFERNDINFSSRENIVNQPVAKVSSFPKDWLPPSDLAFDGVPFDAALRINDSNCFAQSYLCSINDAKNSERVSLSIMGDVVNIVTRPPRNARVFADFAKSIDAQTHPRVRHIIGVHEDISPSVTSFLSLYEGNVVHLSAQKSTSDDDDVCQRCSLAPDICDNPDLLEPNKEQQQSVDCICNTTLSRSSDMDELNRYVEDGWVLYLDEDILFHTRYSVSKLLANIKSRDSLVVFRNLHRSTHHSPSDENFMKEQLVKGDVLASNFAVHSKHLPKLQWPSSRCDGYWAARKLAASLPVEWVDNIVVERNAAKVLKSHMRHSGPPVTVVITSYIGNGWRPEWVRETVEEFSSERYSDLVENVLLVWNNPDEDVPSDVRNIRSTRFQILRMKVNSLNNRWMNILSYVKTSMILNLDDDVYIKREGLLCMVLWMYREPKRMIAPFVRRINGTKYVIDELLNSESYSMALPRVLLLSKDLVATYASGRHKNLHHYVDTQEAHCDDVLLNLVAQNWGIMPLRIALPANSIVDFYMACYPIDREKTGGLALQDKRAEKRSQCVADIMKQYGIAQMKPSHEIASCSASGSGIALYSKVNRIDLSSMTDGDSSGRCGD